MNDSFFSSPNKSQFQSQNLNTSYSYSQTQSMMNSNNEKLPFKMNNDTFIFDDAINVDHNNYSNKSILNGSIMNFNKLNSSQINDTELNKMRKLSEPNNFFQGLVGFSSVHSILNFLNIFDENQKMEIVDNMTKQNYFNLSSIHFSSMIIDLFSFILIPFFIFHIFLLYQSQHSLSFILYKILFISLH